VQLWLQVEDFMCIADRAYRQEQILGMEKSILNKLEWSLTVPTPYVFLLRFIKAAICDKEVRGYWYFFLYWYVLSKPKMLSLGFLSNGNRWSTWPSSSRSWVWYSTRWSCIAHPWLLPQQSMLPDAPSRRALSGPKHSSTTLGSLSHSCCMSFA